jgi:hypothetical protein
MMKSRQTVAQQSHRLVGARCQSLSLLAKVKQQRAPFRLIFEVGDRRSFLEFDRKKEAHSTRVPRRRLRFTGK